MRILVISTLVVSTTVFGMEQKVSPPTPAASAASIETACTVSGVDAYAYYMPDGYAIRRCETKSKESATPEEQRRAACPEMWASVVNVSDATCRSPTDRRNRTSTISH